MPVPFVRGPALRAARIAIAAGARAGRLCPLPCPVPLQTRPTGSPKETATAPRSSRASRESRLAWPPASRPRAGGREAKVDAARRALSTPTVSSLSRDWIIRTILSSATRRFSSRSRSLTSEERGVPGAGGVAGGSRRIRLDQPEQVFLDSRLQGDRARGNVARLEPSLNAPHLARECEASSAGQCRTRSPRPGRASARCARRAPPRSWTGRPQ